MESNGTGDDNTPPPIGNNASAPDWFAGVRRDRSLSVLTVAVAREISAGRPLSLVEISDAIDCALRTVSNALDRLEERGHIIRHPGGGNGRKSRFELTGAAP